MGRRAKPAKAKLEGKRSPARKSPKAEDARVRDLEKRLAEASSCGKATYGRLSAPDRVTR